MMYENKKILIVGGSGFIGKHLFSRLSKKNKILIIDLETDNSSNQFRIDVREKIQSLKEFNAESNLDYNNNGRLQSSPPHTNVHVNNHILYNPVCLVVFFLINDC